MEMFHVASYAICAVLTFCWWFIGGSLFLFTNSIYHSETNMLINNLKSDGIVTKEQKYKLYSLRALQILHCLLYCVFPFGFYVIWHWIYIS